MSTLDQAYRHLRGATHGDLRFDEHVRTVRYVIAPDGRLVIPAMVAMLGAAETVLFVPEYAEGALELLLSLEELDEHGPQGGLTDRWRIYHGEPEDVRWAMIEIDSRRHGETVIDGEAMMRPNPLAGDEAALCRWLNQLGHDPLRRLCLTYGGAEVEEPVVVGIDDLGIDVRRRFDVVRVPATAAMDSAQEARRTLEQMLHAAPQAS